MPPETLFLRVTGFLRQVQGPVCALWEAGVLCVPPAVTTRQSESRAEKSGSTVNHARTDAHTSECDLEAPNRCLCGQTGSAHPLGQQASVNWLPTGWFQADSFHTVPPSEWRVRWAEGLPPYKYPWDVVGSPQSRSLPQQSPKQVFATIPPPSAIYTPIFS